MPSNTPFTTIRTEGALLPPDLLQRIVDGDPSLSGLTAESYHRPGEKLNEVINQSWNTLQGIWVNFKTARDRLPAGDVGTTLTRERWLLPLFRELDYGRLGIASAGDFTIDDKNYPVSHKSADGLPVHLISYQLDLDRRTPGVAGASTASPHSLVQVLLNRTETQTWGFLSNGYKLRILRDNASLTRQAYVEFDLQAMMDGEVYSDFVLVWLLCHQSRLEGGRDCWLEKWAQTAQQQGTRALDQLRDGVQAAIEALGIGFLDHPQNTLLRDRLHSGDLSAQDYYRQLLRLVYRLLVMFTAEDRELLYDPASTESARKRYSEHYSMRRLRRIAERLKGTRHADLYEALRLVTRLLGGEIEGAASLGLPVLDSFLFRDVSLADLIDCTITNVHLLDAVRALAFVEDTRTKTLRTIDYRNLGPEELGSVYESLLELHPHINIAAKTFALATAGGNERKTTGSYYTPTSLINALLDSALAPVIAEARSKADPETALLDLKVCDPACGSGHFLIAAAHRIASELARVRTGEEAPAPNAHRAALRDVIGHCIYGVDMNEMAVELCKVNLWLEALEPGKPLNFLDHRIQVGNSLLGTTPTLMAKGIPDNAFNPIEGDEKEDAAWLKKLNRQERKEREKLASGQKDFLHLVEQAANYHAIAEAVNQLDEIPDDTLDGLRRKEQAYAELDQNPERQKAQILADAWCAAFVWDKGVSNKLPPMTDLQYRRLQETPFAPNFEGVRRYIYSVKKRYQFFHWHIAFPDVFSVSDNPNDAGATETGWQGGFDCVIGNPPWERTAFEDAEFFATRSPEILAALTTAERKARIEELKVTDPVLYSEYSAEYRKSSAESYFFTSSGLFPRGASGRLNTYALFTDLSLLTIAKSGRSGIIVQTSIATAAPMEDFWRYLVKERKLVSIIDFENREKLFPAVHAEQKFCLLTLCGSSRDSKSQITAGFWLTKPEQMMDTERVYELPITVLSIINPNTSQPPVARTKKDFQLVERIYRSNIIYNSQEEKIHFARAWRALMTANSSEHFKSKKRLDDGDFRQDGTVGLLSRVFIPLIESKLVHQFEYLYATYDGASEQAIKDGNPVEIPDSLKQRPNIRPIPRFWASIDVVEEMYSAKEWNFNWSIGVRDVTNVNNERTAICCILPRVGLIQPLNAVSCDDVFSACLVVSTFNSFVVDYVARQKISDRHLNVTTFSQLPVPSRDVFTPQIFNFIVPRVLELTYIAWDLQPFAQDIGYQGAPFVWDEERRFLMRCELDALYFHLYGINRDDVDYIMNTFPIVKRKDEAKHGEYLTKRIILEIYDEMAALGGVVGYQTRLDPPPADVRAAHPLT